MRIVVTGAAGFIGSHVVRACLARGHETIALVRPGSPAERLADVRPLVTMVEGDLADDATIGRLTLDLAPVAIVHLAWYAEPGRYLDDVGRNLSALRATTQLLEAAAATGCPRVVLAGTCLENADGPSRSIYQAAKRAAHAVAGGFVDPSTSIACGHVFHLFGPGEDKRRVIPTVIRALLDGQPVPTTDGSQVRDYLHVADVATAFCTLAEASVTGGVDICSGSPVHLRDVFAMIGDETGDNGLIRIGALGPAVDDGHPSTGDRTQLSDLGWRPAYDLRGGLVDSIDWWRGEGART